MVFDVEYFSFVFLAGSLPTSNSRQQEPSNARSVSINILSAGGMQSSAESDRQIPSSVMQFIRTLFPGGEIHVEDGSSEGTAAGSQPDPARASSGVQGEPEAESRPSDEGIIFSNLLRQIIPIVSRQADSESNSVHPEQANVSETIMAQDSSTQVSMPCSSPVWRLYVSSSHKRSLCYKLYINS